jgi:LAO/AO transport system kinase
MAGSGAALARRVRDGDRRALARAITLVESQRRQDRSDSIALLQALTPYAGRATRIGISGVPGVGKSTFIEILGKTIIEQGRRVAVLAVDPSSAVSGGSILGDKTRMEELSRHPDAYIRPSPTGGTLGGVTRRTRESMIICEAAGFDVVLVETVGVGQSETAVADMTDMLVLLLLPGGGDELQGIKRGIVELADLILVNKADGEMTDAAQRAAADYRNALRLLRARDPDWEVPVDTCSALTGAGIAAAWQRMDDYRQRQLSSGSLAERRRSQSLAWLKSETAERLISLLEADPDSNQLMADLQVRVADGDMLPSVAAEQLVAAFLKDVT